MKAALISLGSTSSEWTYESMTKYFDSVDHLNLKNIEVTLGIKPKVLCGGKAIKKYDCIFAKGSFRYAQVLQSITALLYDKCYMPIAPEAFTYVHDKLLTHLILQKYYIPMPKTFITSTTDAAKKILKERIKFPIVMKFPRGTGGKGVMFADSFSSASSLLDALVSINQPFIIQEYIETGGEDIRVIVGGDKVIASYKRIADKSEKRANIHSGGKGISFMPDSYTKKLALSVSKFLKADIMGIDILMSPKGPLVIEANLSPGLQGVTKITKTDVSGRIAKFLYKKTVEKMGKKKEKGAKEILQEIKDGAVKELITTPTIRSGRIILPEILNKVANFSEHEDVVYEFSDGHIIIKKF